MKPKKAGPDEKKPERKYEEPISLYPLKLEDALSAFMKVDPKKVAARERKGGKNPH
jgi:hypothetical protein